MRRVYYQYELWEDYQRGMYALTAPDQERAIEDARLLLANPAALYHAMAAATLLWQHACEVNLTNRSRNRQAWLGQAACCLLYQTPESLTKLGWHRLTDAEQRAANAVADQVIVAWERRYTAREVADCA
jgi:hypothetical protein